MCVNKTFSCSGVGQELAGTGSEEGEEVAQGETQGKAQEEEEKEIPVRFRRLLRQWLRYWVLELEFFKTSINRLGRSYQVSVVEDLCQDWKQSSKSQGDKKVRGALTKRWELIFSTNYSEDYVLRICINTAPACSWHMSTIRFRVPPEINNHAAITPGLPVQITETYCMYY